VSIDLQGKVAIVTGASRGIGFEIAMQLAAHGAQVVCVATTLEGAQKAAESIEVKGYKAKGYKANVANQEEVNGLIQAVVADFSKIDILVNNAGITKDNLIMRMSSEEWDAVIQTNLNSVFYTSKAVLRPMLKQRYGRIVNVTSVVGLMGNAGQANYAASKAGVIGFTKSLAREYASKGLTCNAVAPGFIQTDMISALPKEYLDNIMASVPQQRLGTPLEVANAVLFLSSDLSAYVTGEVIRVDGGMRM